MAPSNLMATIHKVNATREPDHRAACRRRRRQLGRQWQQWRREDYVLAKRRALIQAGISPSALRIAYVKTRGGEGHAILVVKTDRGEFVLDNLNGKVRLAEPVSGLPYRLDVRRRSTQVELSSAA